MILKIFWYLAKLNEFKRKKTGVNNFFSRIQLMISWAQMREKNLNIISWSICSATFQKSRQLSFTSSQAVSIQIAILIFFDEKFGHLDDEINLITCYDAFAIWLNSRSQSGDQKISADQLLDFLSVHKVSHNLTYQLFNAADLEGTGLVSVSALLDLIKDGHWAHLNELSSVVKRLGKTSLLLGPVDIFGDFDRSEVSNHASQIFQFLQYHQPSPMVFSQFPYQLHDHLVSIRLRLLHSWYAAAQPQAAVSKNDFLFHFSSIK